MKKVVIVILVLIVAAVIGLQLFLAYGLTDSLRQWVLPMVCIVSATITLNY
jgi:hypothetical protein